MPESAARPLVSKLVRRPHREMGRELLDVRDLGGGEAILTLLAVEAQESPAGPGRTKRDAQLIAQGQRLQDLPVARAHISPGARGAIQSGHR